MEGYREMRETPWRKKILKNIFQQPSNLHFQSLALVSTVVAVAVRGVARILTHRVF